MDESGSCDELSGHEKDGNASWNHGGGDDTGNDLRKDCRRSSGDRSRRYIGYKSG